MDDIGLYDCPMPEPFREKVGIVVFLLILFYLGFVSRVIFGPLMPVIQADLDLTNVESGNLFFFVTMGFLVGPMCSGIISARVGHLGNLKVSAWLLGAALLLFLVVDSFLELAAAMMMVGFAGALHLPSAIATITAEIQKSDWGKGLSLHQCGPPLAFFSAPLLVAMSLEWTSWRIILAGWAVLSLAAALLYTIFGKGGEFRGRFIGPASIKEIITIPSFWIMIMLLAMGMAGNAGIFAMLPLFLHTERGLSLEVTNTLLGLSQLSGLLVVPVAGIIIDRVGQKLFMAVSLCMAAATTVLVGMLNGTAMIVALFLQPVFLTALFPAAFGALARVAPPSLRSVSSAVGPPVSFLIGAGGAPMLIGYLADTLSFGAGIVATGCFMATGPFLLMGLRLGDYEGQAGC